MQQRYIIKTHKGERQVERKKAILHAAKAYSLGLVPQGFRAPRGEKGSAVELARRAWSLRKRVQDDRWIKAPTLEDRLEDHLVGLALQQIDARRLSTPAGWPDDLSIEVSDRSDGLCVVRGEGWHEYSKRFGTWRVRAAYLVGRDEGQRFAVRVPYTRSTVDSALYWLKPKPIRDAEDRGLPVRRQGDIFFRPVRGLEDHDMAALRGTEHEARPRKDGGLSICHGQHAFLVLSGKYRWRAYQSTQLAEGGRGGAD